MQITPETLSEMSEAELRKAILIPLFKEMGYKDVREYHGGSQEQGKDIVMWSYNDLGIRRNYAVVAKAQRITGQISGSSSAGEVRMQIAQALGDPYIDPVSGEERSVHQVWVVSNGDIKKEAHNSITNALGDDRRNVQFVDGDKLWCLISENMSLATVSHHLQEVRQVLSELDSDVRIVTETSEEGITYSFEAKQDAEPENITFSFGFEFPDTPEGRSARNKLRDHFERGMPATVSGRYLSNVELPRPIQSLLPDELNDTELQLGAVKSEERLTTKVSVDPPSRPTKELKPVELRGVRVGLDEAEFNNKHQDVPWSIKIIVRRDTREQKISFGAQASGHNAYSTHQAAEFAYALNQGGRVTVSDLESGQTILEFELEANSVANLPPQGWLEFLEALVFIEDTLRTTIEIPDREIPSQEVDEIYRVRRILEHGEIPIPSGTVTIEIDQEAVSKITDMMAGDEPPPVKIRGEERAVVFDEEIELGEKIVTFRPVPFEDEYLRSLEEEITSDEGSEFISIEFMIDEESDGVVEFPAWK